MGQFKHAHIFYEQIDFNYRKASLLTICVPRKRWLPCKRLQAELQILRLAPADPAGPG